MDIFETLPFVLIGLGFMTLGALTYVDLKTWLLPNKLNLILAILGIIYHIMLKFSVLEPVEMLAGLLLGGGTLLVIRFFGNRYYGHDTLGLGDVKLLAAAGLWLGPQGVVMAMTIGAFMGIIHGIIVAGMTSYRTKEPFNLKRLMIPAGPGFCVGIISAFIIQYFHLF